MRAPPAPPCAARPSAAAGLRSLPSGCHSTRRPGRARRCLGAASSGGPPAAAAPTSAATERGARAQAGATSRLSTLDMTLNRNRCAGTPLEAAPDVGAQVQGVADADVQVENECEAVHHHDAHARPIEAPAAPERSLRPRRRRILRLRLCGARLRDARRVGAQRQIRFQRLELAQPLSSSGRRAHILHRHAAARRQRLCRRARRTSAAPRRCAPAADSP